MRRKIVFGSMAVLAAVLLVFGCESAPQARGGSVQTDKGKDYATIKGNEALFKTDANGSLTIRNQANFDVIIFAGNVQNNNVIGAVSAGKARDFDLKKINLPANKGSFLVRAASFEKYSNGLRIKEENIVYTGLVVYDLTDSKDHTTINIFEGVQDNQDSWIYVSNTSKFVLELRLGNPNGESIATLAPLTNNKMVYLAPNRDPSGRILPYDFYATYVYIDPHTNEQKSFTTNDMKLRQRRSPSQDMNPMVFKGPENTSAIGYNVAFFRIKNDANQGFVLRNGTSWLNDQKLRTLVESSVNPYTFEIPALSDTGTQYSNLILEFDDTSEIRMNPVNVIPGMVYDIIVTEVNGNTKYDIRETQKKDKLEDMQMSLFLGN